MLRESLGVLVPVSVPSLSTAAAPTGNQDSKKEEKHLEKPSLVPASFLSPKADAKAGVLPECPLWIFPRGSKCCLLCRPVWIKDNGFATGTRRRIAAPFKGAHEAPAVLKFPLFHKNKRQKRLLTGVSRSQGDLKGVCFFKTS